MMEFLAETEQLILPDKMDSKNSNRNSVTQSQIRGKTQSFRNLKIGLRGFGQKWKYHQDSHPSMVFESFDAKALEVFGIVSKNWLNLIFIMFQGLFMTLICIQIQRLFV